MAERVFCTKADVKRVLPGTVTWTGNDAQIDDLIPHVSEQIRIYCRRTFELGEYTEYFAAPDSFSTPPPVRKHLKETPIATSPAAIVSYDPTGRFASFSSVTQLSEGIDYSIDHEKGVIELLGTCYQYSHRGFKIVYTGGYAVGAEAPHNLVQVPAPVKTAAALQVAFLLERTLAGQMGQASSEERKVPVQFTRSASSGLIAEAHSALTVYRRPLVGRT
jgi:hypothetical protein